MRIMLGVVRFLNYKISFASLLFIHIHIQWYIYTYMPYQAVAWTKTTRSSSANLIYLSCSLKFLFFSFLSLFPLFQRIKLKCVILYTAWYSKTSIYVFKVTLFLFVLLKFECVQWVAIPFNFFYSMVGGFSVWNFI